MSFAAVMHAAWLCGLGLTCAAAQGDEGAVQRPLWEIGLGVAGLRVPDYRGSDQSRTLWFPVPYLVYRGQWLRADREGARAVLLEDRKSVV